MVKLNLHCIPYKNKEYLQKKNQTKKINYETDINTSAEAGTL